MSAVMRLRSSGSSRAQWSRPARRTSKSNSQGAMRRSSMVAAYPRGADRNGKAAATVGVYMDMRLLPLLALALLLAACGSSDSGTSTSTVGAAAAKAPVANAKKDKVGEVVVDAEGRTLYRFTAEAQGLPVCTGDCVATWPPATVPSATDLPDHVATVKRPDGGALQLTYDGHPLYRFSGDQSAADAKGDGVGGQWYAVKAGGGDDGGSGGSGTTESKRTYGY